MRSFKAQLNHLIHKKLDGYCLIILIAINFQKWKKCTLVNMNYILHEHQCIEYICIDVQIDLNSIHIITRSQFFCSIDYNIYDILNAKINTYYLALNLINTNWHYITKTKSILFLIFTLHLFQTLVSNVAIEMHQLQTPTQWNILIPSLHIFYNPHVLINLNFLNTRSFSLRKKWGFWIAISKHLT
jgi:hypothetical protein